MEAKHQEITLGEAVCEKLKRIYFPDKTWEACHKEVARIFTTLKGILRKFFGNKTDSEILQAIFKFTDDDIKEALGVDQVV